MAQQTEPVKRAMAVKVIKAGMDSKAVLARFEAERQALAMMDHPRLHLDGQGGRRGPEAARGVEKSVTPRGVEHTTLCRPSQATHVWRSQ
jgi:hypothetical protein